MDQLRLLNETEDPFDLFSMVTGNADRVAARVAGEAPGELITLRRQHSDHIAALEVTAHFFYAHRKQARIALHDGTRSTRIEEHRAFNIEVIRDPGLAGEDPRLIADEFGSDRLTGRQALKHPGLTSIDDDGRRA